MADYWGYEYNERGLPLIGIKVQAVNPSTGAVLGTGVTDSTGMWSFSSLAAAPDIYIYPEFGTRKILKQGVDWPNANGVLTTLGDILYRAASSLTRLAGNTTATRKFLRQTGTGSASAAPAWDTLIAGDLPAHGASEHTDRTRNIWLPPNVFDIVENTPSLVSFGASARDSATAWAFDAAAREVVGTTLVLPSDYVAGSTITFKVYWAADTDTDTEHACWWIAYYGVIASGDSIAEAISAGSQNIVPNVPSATAKTMTISASSAVSTDLVANALIRLSVGRVGSQAADTMTGDALLLGVLIEYTADM